MSYVPKNLDVFTAAFAGLMAGLVTDRQTLSALPDAEFSSISSTWAQAFDTVWGGQNTTAFDLLAIESLSSQSVSGRFPRSKNAADYVPLATSIANLILTGDSGFVSAGIIVPPTSVSGTTPGLAANETVELTPFIVLTDGNAYLLEYDACIASFDLDLGHDVVSNIIRNKVALRKAGGVTTIANAGSTVQTGEAGTGLFTITMSVGVAPDRVELVFATGAGKTARCNISANINLSAVPYI